MKYVIILMAVYVIAVVVMTFLGIIEEDSIGEYLRNISIGAVTLFLVSSFIVNIDFSIKTASTEVWSGKITKVKHKEEYDEWVPERRETRTRTKSDGRTETYEVVVEEAHWEHHEAENYITTSDRGTFRVYETPDGKRFTDYFVNSNEELEEYYPIGGATASTHTFTNKVKASYSIYNRKEVDLEDYPDLFEYPTKENSYYSINRLLGSFKDKTAKSRYLDEINSELNDTDNKNNKDKVKGYKQVNIIMVNFGDKKKEYGYALQDYWQNGAKNDLVITFGTDKKGKPTWSYVFSWSESEMLKSDIRDLILSVEDINKEYYKTLDEISDLTEKQFSRKEFADFDYIQVEVSLFTKILLVILLLAVIIFTPILSELLF